MMPESTSPDATIHLLVDLIQAHTGLRYDNNRLSMILDRLQPLMVEGNFQSILDYYYYLKYDERADQEWLRVQNALAVNETYFWREYDQIDAAVNRIVPELQCSRPGQPVRIWHAACATGEEPYTMSIALQEAGCFENGPIEITATDFNPKALEQAVVGEYRSRSFRGIPGDIKMRYFQQKGENSFQLDESIRKRVNFSYANLMDKKMIEILHDYDIIFCRNAFIYFSESAVRQVIETFYQVLKPDGFLFVAAAESLLRLTNLFDLVEVGDAFGYRKRTNVTQFNEKYGV